MSDEEEDDEDEDKNEEGDEDDIGKEFLHLASYAASVPLQIVSNIKFGNLFIKQNWDNSLFSLRRSPYYLSSYPHILDATIS